LPDVCRDNVTVDPEGKPFLVDFGICADMDSGVVLTTTVEGFGNRSFAPPECEAGSVDAATEASDVYSLGKLLYWMASGRKFMVRENFNRDSLTIADQHAAQYISSIIHRTVREDPGTRWTATELLRVIDWALDKLREHAAIRENGLIGLADGFGPNGQCNESGQRSATRAPLGNPPGDWDLAESFFVRDAVTLDQIRVGVRVMHGSRRVEVELVKGGDEVPSGEWLSGGRRKFRGQAAAVQVLELPSEIGPTLGPSEVYWVILSPGDVDSEIAWSSAALELLPRQFKFAIRELPNEWEPRVSTQGPGLALRVLARAPQ
jgi:hypothetical protein